MNTVIRPKYLLLLNENTKLPYLAENFQIVIEEEKIVALTVGCDGFYRKPFKDEEIFEAIRHHLGVEYVYEKIVYVENEELKEKYLRLREEV